MINQFLASGFDCARKVREVREAKTLLMEFQVSAAEMGKTVNTASIGWGLSKLYEKVSKNK